MLVGQTVSALGDWLGTVAVMVMVLRLSGSATAVGGVLVLQLLPAAVAAPLVCAVPLWIEANGPAGVSLGNPPRIHAVWPAAYGTCGPGSSVGMDTC
jgi:hypothetical protein